VSDDGITPRKLAFRVARAKIGALPWRSSPPRALLSLDQAAIPLLPRKVSIKTLAPKPPACLIAYVRRLDERRVLFHPYHMEVLESCVGSLDEVRHFTDEALAQIENPAARAALGAILDRSRAFVDRWRGSHGLRDPWDHGGFHRGPGSQGESMAEFFQDLGELRGTMRDMLELLKLLEPKIEAPNLL